VLVSPTRPGQGRSRHIAMKRNPVKLTMLFRPTSTPFKHAYECWHVTLPHPNPRLSHLRLPNTCSLALLQRQRSVSAHRFQRGGRDRARQPRLFTMSCFCLPPTCSQKGCFTVRPLNLFG